MIGAASSPRAEATPARALGRLVRAGLVLLADALIVLGLTGAILSYSGHLETALQGLEAVGLGDLSRALRTTLLSQVEEGPELVPAPIPTAERELLQATLAEPPRPIRELRIPRIALESEVVVAPLGRLPQGVTWEVPAFKVGHAEGTAGAGQSGNAILIGHLTSQTLGSVFLHLDRVRPGDAVYLGADGDEFAYVVEEVRRVPRDELSVIQPTDLPTVTIVTCTGDWLPTERDYAERLIVRARLG